jgi:D-glycero-D-manno-heptose 1,7-bisphosphate phosphatase
VAGRGAVFLDRDGTVIEDRHYLGEPDGVVLLPTAAAAIARLNRAGVPAILVTNQSGIGRGLFSEADFGAVQRRMEDLLGEGGARLDAVYHCPHAPDALPACTCRKPAPGLFLRAARDHGLDLARSAFVGDRVRDVAPAEAWGGTPILVRTGAGAELPPGAEPPPRGTVSVDSLEAAVLLALAAVLRD